MLRTIAGAALFVMLQMPAMADDLAACHFARTSGTCTPSFGIDKATNNYTIGANGVCMTVTVLVDGTQYPHRMKNANVVDSVMVLDKTKDYSASVSDCTTHPTKAEVVEQCRPSSSDCKAPFAEASSCKAAAGEDMGMMRQCYAQFMQNLRTCLQRITDEGNACAGGAAFRVDFDGRNFTIPSTNKF